MTASWERKSASVTRFARSSLYWISSSRPAGRRSSSAPARAAATATSSALTSPAP
ncbi:MAG TPA: hypothetical protein VG142_18945 [Trebonia sp.]|nr:hypothetical protein [Trebonia sp.]